MESVPVSMCTRRIFILSVGRGGVNTVFSGFFKVFLVVRLASSLARRSRSVSSLVRRLCVLARVYLSARGGPSPKTLQSSPSVTPCLPYLKYHHLLHPAD